MPRKTTSSALRGRLLRALAACAVLLALAGYLVVHFSSAGPGAPRCTVRGDGKDGSRYELDPEQAVNAATIEAVGSSRGLPERAVTIALATAMQESGLRNIDYGDRDSVGLFQQRPTQGWGTVEEIMDPVYAAGKFYDHLVEVPGYSRLPLTVAAQKVQRSGYPQAYAKHEPDAALLSSALTGRLPQALSCTTGRAAEPGNPALVREKLRRDFGRDVLAGGPERADGADASGQGGGAGKSRPEPVIGVPVPDGSGAGGARRGWELAHWAVAHASELGIAQVSYAGRVWSASDSGGEWREADGGFSPAGGSGTDPGSGTVLISTVQ
ncbi:MULTISPECIES: hypothetical protein [Streptomyces]|uniref:ARB-07466-like C-terminal domain-containing protein n=1 Tax=Streptomyces lycii TaxID=2654337 RepID=A0ABQ7FRB4_9ACTN|nr:MULTISPECIES: hypothetical protein [Streptomyces]KAF4410406.1 hypothetical protein GCU69_04020 [Streptomyces lycii]PGH47114.1 hypothetical protein CRI70_30320 [Streptomyces sp. Ru87]